MVMESSILTDTFSFNGDLINKPIKQKNWLYLIYFLTKEQKLSLGKFHNLFFPSHLIKLPCGVNGHKQVKDKLAVYLLDTFPENAELTSFINSITDSIEKHNLYLLGANEINDPKNESFKKLCVDFFSLEQNRDLLEHIQNAGGKLPILLKAFNQQTGLSEIDNLSSEDFAKQLREYSKLCVIPACGGTSACGYSHNEELPVSEQTISSTRSSYSSTQSTVTQTTQASSNLSSSSRSQPSFSGNSSTRPTKPTSSGSSVGNDGSGGGGSHSCGDPDCNVDHGKKVETTELPHNPNVCTDENCTIDHNLSAPKSPAQSIKKNAVWAWGIFAACALGLIALIVNGIMNKKDESEVSIDLNKISSDNQTQSSINSIQSVIAKQKSLTSPSQQIARKTNSKIIPISSSSSRSPRVNSRAVIQTKNSQKNSQDPNPQNQAA
jgi:hypothetical protein